VLTFSFQGCGKLGGTCDALGGKDDCANMAKDGKATTYWLVRAVVRALIIFAATFDTYAYSLINVRR